MPFIKAKPDSAAHQPAHEPTPQDYAAQAALLAAPQAHVRRAAAQALGAHAEAVPALLAAVAAEGEQPVRSAMLDALAQLAARGSEEAVSGLADCLRSEDAWLRNAAIELLRGLPSQVASVMAHLLVDWDRDVRILAVGILDQLRHERVEEWLLQLIEADADVNVCGAALDVLADVATPAALAPVTRLLARFPAEPYLEFAGALVRSRLHADAAAQEA